MTAIDPWLVVFDLDGTLIDSSLDLCLAVNAAMTHVGSPELPHTVIAGFIGNGAATLVRRALSASDPGDSSSLYEGQGRFEAAFRYFLEFYRAHKLDNTRLYEGVLPALDQIRAARPDLPMAVLTNKPVGPSRDLCRALGLDAYMFANYGGDSFPTKKPDPSGLMLLMSEARLRVPHNRDGATAFKASGVVMVGDSDVDVLTARNAGARSLGCLYGLSPKALVSAHPDTLCDHPRDWPRLLGLES